MKDESCRNCVFMCGVHSLREADVFVCTVEHFDWLRDRTGGAQPQAITVLRSSMCELHMTRTEFDDWEVFR
jgi:hypothetical protein